MLPRRPQPLDRIRDVDRELREHQRDPVVPDGLLPGEPGRDRHQRAHRAVRGFLAGLQEQPAEAAGHRGEHDVVERPAVLLPDRRDVGQRTAGDGEPPGRRQRPGERGAVGRHERAGQRGQPARGVQRPARRTPGWRRAPVRGTDLRDRVDGQAGERAGRQGQVRRLRLRAPVVGLRRRGVGVGSSTTPYRSVPETPSTMQWCTLEISAQRPPCSRSTSQYSHSGRLRSSRAAITRPISADSSASRPGAGSAVRRRW